VMGEAKRRGTYEQRKEEGERKRQEEERMRTERARSVRPHGKSRASLAVLMALAAMSQQQKKEV